MERPPAEPARLLSAWAEGEAGETTPGRTLANLKTGGLRDVLEHLGPNAPEAESTPVSRIADNSALLAAWMEWERGETPPGAVFAALSAAGLRPVLESLAGSAGAAGAAAGAGRG